MTSAGRRCAFVDRPCRVEVDEIPLEVCRTCIEAWKFYEGRATVRRPTGGGVQERPPLRESLAELDRLFAEGRLSIEEYLKRRKEVVSSAIAAAPGPRSLKGLLDVGPTGLVVIGRGAIERTYPEGLAPPEGLVRAAKSLHELSRVLDGGLEVSTPLFKLRCLSVRDGRSVFLVASPEWEGPALLDEEARSILEGAESLEEALPKVYERLLEAKPVT